MDKCSDEQYFLKKKRDRSDNSEQGSVHNSDKSDNLNEEIIETNDNMFKILKTIEGRNKSAETCILCTSNYDVYPICSIQEYIYLCKYLYTTDEIKNCLDFKQSYTNYSLTYLEHQREGFKDIQFKYIKAICKSCLLDNLKKEKGFNIVYYMLINENFKNNFVKKEKQDDLDNILDMLSNLTTPTVPDFSTLFNNNENIDKVSEEIKKNFFSLQYDNLLQKLFLSYILSNLETFMGQLMKTQLLCDRMMENVNYQNINEKLYLIRNMYSYGGNLIKELSANLAQLKSNANKIFRNGLSDINESINLTNINNSVNRSYDSIPDITYFIYSHINYLSPELNMQMLFNQLASNYNQILRVSIY
jgi:hypothetical protein